MKNNPMTLLCGPPEILVRHLTLWKTPQAKRTALNLIPCYTTLLHTHLLAIIRCHISFRFYFFVILFLLSFRSSTNVLLRGKGRHDDCKMLKRLYQPKQTEVSTYILNRLKYIPTYILLEEWNLPILVWCSSLNMGYIEVVSILKKPWYGYNYYLHFCPIELKYIRISLIIVSVYKSVDSYQEVTLSEILTC